MIEIEVECWEIYESFDRDVSHVAYFKTEALAENYLHKRNSPYLGKKKFSKFYCICESLEDHEAATIKLKKEAALAKLTLEERKLLGLA